MATLTNATQQIIQRHDQFITINYPRYPIAMSHGKGSRLWDADGKPYLDLFAGFGAGLLGHCHSDVVAAVTEQANKLWHVGNLLHTEPQTRAAEAIAKHGFGGRSFFCHAGADANEAAIKLARLYGHANPSRSGPRYKVITCHRSFHGRSFATMFATGQPKVREGFDPGIDAHFIHVPFNDLAAIEQAIDDQTIAVMLEPIQGEGGVNVPDDEYLSGLRRLCDERDLILICDEVWTGVGRTGKWFAHQHWLPPENPPESAPESDHATTSTRGPDIMTLAKGVGGGLPVGVMCAGPRVADLYDFTKVGAVKHATTLGGNCLSMAACAAVFQVIERDNLTDHANELSDHIKQRVESFAKHNAIVKAVRGRGLFMGIDLNLPEGMTIGAIVKTCLERGVLINGTQNTVLRLAPALTITRAEIDEGLDVVEDVLQTL